MRHQSARRFVCLCLLTLTVFLAAPGKPQASMVTNLQGYWHLNGNALDSSGNGYDLTLHGGLGYSTGVLGQGLNFTHNNSQDAARAGNDAAFNFGSNDFSVQVWVNFNSTATEQVLIEKLGGSLGSTGWGLTKLSDNNIRFITGTGVSVDSGVLAIANGTWHQLVATRAGSNFNLYFDNVLVGTGSSASALSSTTNPLLLGRRYTSGDGRDFSLDGHLDEVAIWTRTLTATEVSTLYNDGTAAQVPEPSTSVLVLAGAAGIALQLAIKRWRKREPKVNRA